MIGDKTTGEAMDTPHKIAEGFKRAIGELLEKGKVKSPEVEAFLTAATKAADAMAASQWAIAQPESVRALMERATIMAVAAGGLMDVVLGAAADKSKLN